MKIQFIIEFETDKHGNPARMRVRRMREVSPADEKIAAQMQKNLEQSDVLESAFPFKRKPKRAK